MPVRSGYMIAVCVVGCASTVGGVDAGAPRDAAEDAPVDGALSPMPPVDPSVPRRIVRVAAAPTVTGALDERGVVWLWGAMESQEAPGVDVTRLDRCPGLVPDSTLPCSSRPVPLAFPEPAVAFELTSDGVCIVGRSGRLSCSATVAPARFARPGDVPGNFAVLVEGLHDVTQVALGGSASCAVWAGGTRLSCWTADRDGARLVGGGDRMLHEVVWPTPIRAAAVGFDFACVLGTDGRIQCWGGNLLGVLGEAPRCDGPSPADDNFHPAPRLVGDARRAAGILPIAGGLCARWEDGGASCWGGLLGSLIRGDDPPCCDGAPCSIRPRDVPGGAFHSLALGWTSCAVRADRSLWCADEAEVPRFPPRSTWVPVAAPRSVEAVATGTSHLCILDDAGRLSCRGSNEHGELGDGSREDRSGFVPVQFPWLRGP